MFVGASTLRFARAVIALGAVASLIACGTTGTTKEPATGAASVATHFTEADWKAPREADIPNDSLGASIKRGLYLIRFTPESLPAYATTRMRCTSCHQDDGLKASAAPLSGSHARFPKYMSRSGAVIALADRVNYCFTRSLAGNAIPVGSREMVDILAYLAFISHDVPVGRKTAGTDGLISMQVTLEGDTTRGRDVFEKTCIVCHLKEGGGNGPIPALWGPMSYSIGASMARQERAASFIWHNMPQSAPGTLTTQQAFDLSAFINAHPRPDSPGKESDWPMGGAPKDVPYGTQGHEAFKPPRQLLPRANPQGALVPKPAVLGRVNR